MIRGRLLTRLHHQAQADRWRVSEGAFAEALERSATKHFGDRRATETEVERFLESLRLEDLALACACAAGDDEAWQHFVTTFRPSLYRAADAIDTSGRSRELVDSLYADLFGLTSRDGERRSLFRYFHGRSSLTTWLRAVLSQRHIDRLRAERVSDPLPDDESPRALPAHEERRDPEHDQFVSAMRAALAVVLASLNAHDRLRMACYYAQRMTLAQIGRLLGEHEATVSRQLSRTRALVRAEVAQWLRRERGLTDDGVAACFASVTADVGALDLSEWLPSAPSDGVAPRGDRRDAGSDASDQGLHSPSIQGERKKSADVRSKEGSVP